MLRLFLVSCFVFCLVNNAVWVGGVGLVCVFGFVWLLGCCPCSFGVCLLWGVKALVFVGECGCLGAGCVVGGGVLPSWLGGAVAGGGVGVSFDVGLRVFVLSGVSVPAPECGSVSSLAASGSAIVGSLASSPVGSAPSSVSGSVGSASSCGGVVVCVPCAVRVFGVGWCGVVLRRWARAAGVGGASVDALICSAGSGFVSGGRASGSGCVSDSVSVSGSEHVTPSRVASGSVSSSVCSPSPVSGGSVSAPGSLRGGRVGVGFGARVRDWDARVGVGGGVVSGGGVVLGWWARARGLVCGLVGGVGVLGLVLAGVVGVVVLVSVLVLVG